MRGAVLVAGGVGAEGEGAFDGDGRLGGVCCGRRSALKLGGSAGESSIHWDLRVPELEGLSCRSRWGR